MKLDTQKCKVKSQLSIKAEKESYALIIFHSGEASVKTENKTFFCNKEELVLLKPGKKTDIKNKDNKTEMFRNKYRQNIDVLLIDDIQFIAGKELK